VVDEWARLDASPTNEEITRVRRLINRIKGDISQLTEPEQAQIRESVAVIRRHRAVSLGTPTIRTAPTNPAIEATA
jgi:hypothetical protein